MPRKQLHSPKQIEKWRGQIEVGRLLGRLQAYVHEEEWKGKQVEMTTAQMKAAEILLRKALPDLSAVELTGHGGEPIQFAWKPAIVEQSTVIDMTAKQHETDQVKGIEDNSDTRLEGTIQADDSQRHDPTEGANPAHTSPPEKQTA